MPDSNSQGLFVPPVQSALSSTQSSEQFLRLRLPSERPVLLPIQQLTEVLNIAKNQIMPIPHLPAWVMGVYNWRGEILWMIDLGHLCGLAPWYQHPLSRSTHSAVVLNVISDSHSSTNAAFAKGQLLGLVVKQVEDIEWCNLNAVQPVPATSTMPNLAPFAARYWQTDHEILPILDAVAILKAMPQSR